MYACNRTPAFVYGSARAIPLPGIGEGAALSCAHPCIFLEHDVGRAPVQFGHVVELVEKVPTPAVADRSSTIRSPISAWGSWR